MQKFNRSKFNIFIDILIPILIILVIIITFLIQILISTIILKSNNFTSTFINIINNNKFRLFYINN